MCAGVENILNSYGIAKPIYSEYLYNLGGGDIDIDLTVYGAKAVQVNWICATLVALGGTGSTKGSISDQYGRGILFLSDIPGSQNIFHVNALSKGNRLFLQGFATFSGIYTFTIQYQYISDGAQ